MKRAISAALLTASTLTACVSPHKQRPAWVADPKVTWTEGDQVFFKTQYSVRGDERLNGCYQLAKLESKETLLREIAEEIRGRIDNAQQSISENAEILLNQSRTSEFQGRVTGVRNLEQYNERTLLNGEERIDCFLLSAIRNSDYESVRRAVVTRVVGADPKLKETLNQRQVDFYSPRNEEP